MNAFSFLAQADAPAPQPQATDAQPVEAQPAEAQTTEITQAPGSSDASPAGTQNPPGWLNSPMIPLLVGILILYFFVFRSKRNQDRQRKEMLAQLKKGDRVQTIGGILGTVVEAQEDVVLLKVDESSNTKIRFSRNAIHRVLTGEKSESK